MSLFLFCFIGLYVSSSYVITRNREAYLRTENLWQNILRKLWLLPKKSLDLRSHAPNHQSSSPPSLPTIVHIFRISQPPLVDSWRINGGCHSHSSSAIGFIVQFSWTRLSINSRYHTHPLTWVGKTLRTCPRPTFGKNSCVFWTRSSSTPLLVM